MHENESSTKKSGKGLIMRKQIFRLSIFQFLLTITCLAVSLPKTPAGKRAQEIIDLLNETGSNKLDDYIQNNFAPGFRDAFPVAAHKSVFQQTQPIFEKVTPAEILESSEDAISIVLKSETKAAALNLVLKVEPDKPYRIATMGFKPYAAGNATPSNKISEKSGTRATTLEELNDKLLEMAYANQFSGTMLIAKDGKPIFKNAYGLASKRFDVPNNIETKFNLGSVNKIFTEVAMTQLIQQGKVSIDDPIGKYLKMFPKDVGEKVTIRHLLDMTSGWGDYWDNEYYLAHKDRLNSVSDYLEFIRNMPLSAEPGTKFQHSNTGYEVAGAIIEAVSGMDYYDYIRNNIYEPAGMSNSDSYFRDSPISNLAEGYTNMNPNDSVQKDYTWENTYILAPRGTPAGGGYSTVDDLLKFDIALRSGVLLNEKFTRYLLSRFRKTPEATVDLPKNIYRIAGGAPGVNAFLGMDFQDNYTVIILSNYDFPAAMDISNDIIKMLNIK